MGECDFPDCPGDSSFKNSCSYCGFSYCSNHRLPEKHNCSTLSDLNTLGPDFRGEINLLESVPNEQSVSETTEKSECNRCSNYTRSDCELCLECRREEQTISSRSPDLSADGSIESKDDSENEDADSNSSEASYLTSNRSSDANQYVAKSTGSQHQIMNNYLMRGCSNPGSFRDVSRMCQMW